MRKNARTDVKILEQATSGPAGSVEIGHGSHSVQSEIAQAAYTQELQNESGNGRTTDYGPSDLPNPMCISKRPPFSPLPLLTSHPTILESILTYSTRRARVRLLRCCKDLYASGASLIYTNITISANRYTGIFAITPTQGKYASKQDILQLTRSIKVTPTERTGGRRLLHEDFAYTTELVPNLSTLSWYANERLPALAYKSSLEHVVIRTSHLHKGSTLPFDCRNLTLIPEKPYSFAYPYDSDPGIYNEHNLPRDAKNLTVVYPPPKTVLREPSDSPRQSDWRAMLCWLCPPHMWTKGGTVRIVGFELSRRCRPLISVPGETDSAWIPWNETESLKTQVIDSLDRWFAEAQYEERPSMEVMRDKIKVVSYPEWMPEGRRLGIMSLAEEAAMLAAERKLMSSRRA